MAAPFPLYSLPLEARKRIYYHLGLSGCTVDLNYNHLVLYARNAYPDDVYAYSAWCFHDAQSKFTRCEDYHTLKEYWEGDWDEYDSNFPGSRHCEDWSCRGAALIKGYIGYFGSKSESPELYRTVFEENHFRICSSSPNGFAPFFALPKGSLRDLGTLTVRLDGEPVDTIEVDDDWERLGQLVPLELHSRYGKYALKEWEKLVQYLAQYIQPSQLTLYLIVSVPDVETATPVLNSLYQLPRLKDCGIWLNEKFIPELRTLAEETVERLTASTSKERFRYLDLPIEIRWRILEYSDLVYKGTLEWKPPLSSLGTISNPRCRCEGQLGSRKMERDRHLPDCTGSVVDASTLNIDYDEIVSPQHCCRGTRHHYSCERHYYSCKVTQAGFCECIFNCTHSAQSSSNLLGPRKGVHPLFLVSKHVRQDALAVFFQRNRFVVSPPATIHARLAGKYPPSLHGVIPMTRLELSLFLTSLPRHALHHIRYLEWLLPPFENYTRAPKSAYLDYLDTIELMAQAMNLSQLTLVLNLRAIGNIRDQWDRIFPERSHSDGAMYDRILGPLCRLKGLKNFFIYLRRVRKRDSTGMPWGSLYERDSYVFDNDEMRFEKAVMGENYDSRARGKEWMERFERRIARGDYYDERARLDGYGDYT